MRPPDGLRGTNRQALAEPERQPLGEGDGELDQERGVKQEQRRRFGVSPGGINIEEPQPEGLDDDKRAPRGGRGE